MSDTTQRTQPQAEINGYWNAQAARLGACGAPHHNVRNGAQRRVWLDALRPLLPSPPADVLDVGTGTGFLALLLAELGHRVTGIDLSEGMLADCTTIWALLEKTSLGPGLTRNDPQFTHVIVSWLEAVGFQCVRATDLIEVDRFEAAQGSDHPGWLALTALKPLA